MNKRLKWMLIAFALMAVGVGIMALSGTGKATLSAAEFKAAIDECTAAGGAPKPIYDHDDPARVFKVECPKPEAL